MSRSSNTTAKSSKKSTKRSTKKSARASWGRRAMAYLPAWLLLIGILVIYILSETNSKSPLSGLGDGLRGLTHRNSDEYGGIYNPDAPLAEFFTPSVDYWQLSIERWADETGLNPNLVATVMQIESCGHPYVGSGAGAQGLFQIIPLYHFQDGDNQFDPDTNAQAGLKHMHDCLRWSADTNLDGVADTDPDVGLALVCYNGGLGAMQTPRSQWVQESHNYYTWGLGIWGDASRGSTSSETLSGWLRSGGEILCSEALQAQKLTDPLNSN